MSIMSPQTAREAWERGYDDAQRYYDFGSPENWVAITGSDPTEKGYAERIFGPLARDWQAGWDAAYAPAGTIEMCNCEHEDHWDKGLGHHAYMAAPAGERKAQHVGRVCDWCADTHMAPFLIPQGV